MYTCKIINDPVFGFIKIPQGLLLDIIKHPFMQRLNRIKQLGLASVVYPGAQHTRFLHSIGSFFLMSEAINSLSQKGVYIFDSEAEAVEAAILMHDIGHGPFSHVLENTLIPGISHEEISLMVMEQMNEEMNGKLNLALKIFKDEYPKRFLHQLISSQVDVDRLDYLCRDSFFTGVSEGNIGSARIIKMLNVVDDNLAVDLKGIYSMEHYLTARRHMYWQVYLHKTAVSCEKVLVNTLMRAKELIRKGKKIFAPPALLYFLQDNVTKDHFRQQSITLRHYLMLDDNDIWSTIKEWTGNDDLILSILSKNLINRNIFKVEVGTEPFDREYVSNICDNICQSLGIHREDAHYLVNEEVIQQDMYNIDEDRISILYKDGSIKDISESSDIFNIGLLSQKNRKYYLCYQRI
ncbi:MAG: HD domain-containing protein [Prevotellaceae bacterium]|nr:HD domain-containing protein [Prevotella sp.]MDD7257262.1 HD domain-containing protein [Prevotellaceae bacterium]MDY6130320.1 HD domain-containing protein [Prevotella sp.]